MKSIFNSFEGFVFNTMRLQTHFKNEDVNLIKQNTKINKTQIIISYCVYLNNNNALDSERMIRVPTPKIKLY